MMMLSLCASISIGLGPLVAGKFLRRKRGTAEQRWPGSIGDILPNYATPGEVLDTLLRWAVEPGHGQAAFSLISALARFWEPFTAEVLNRPDVFFLATRHLQYVADTHIDSERSRTWLIVEPCASPFVTLAEINFSHLGKIVQPLFEPLNSVGKRLKPMLDPVSDASIIRWFGNVAAMVDPPVSQAVYVDGLFIASGSLVIEGATEPLGTVEEIYLRTFTAIWEARHRNQCMRLGCTTPMVQRSVPCGGCRVVRYCSRECQRAAWKSHPLHPHKLLCENNFKLRTAFKMLENSVWDRLIVDLGIKREPKPLLEICQPLSWEMELGVVFAIQVGLVLLSRAKAQEALQNSRVA
ncbi:hypothetical protein B0H16DRAFT_1469953 [Mycena metata]|uniref:MYND-type domain-containing protein n=1 Tax=Mycena metata TaxID=1033252 RepID=A0AAD7MT77_9AGAR|nr:hypothetical protein B0H16DRAFT_1469953 [Mycena metata]